jgi:hypothetical protein
MRPNQLIKEFLMWRLFFCKNGGLLRLLNLAKPHSFGMVYENGGSDPEYIQEYKFIQEWFEARLACQMDVECYLEDHYIIHEDDFEDAAEVVNGVLKYQNDGEDSRYYERGGYITLVPNMCTPSADPMLAISRDIQEQKKILEKMQDILLASGQLTKQADAGCKGPPIVEEVHPLPASTGEIRSDRTFPVRMVMRDHKILPTSDAVTPAQAATILRHFKIKVVRDTLCNTWIKKGQIKHRKDGGHYRIDIESICEIIENQGPLHDDSYPSFYTSDPRKRPRRFTSKSV